MTKSTPENLHAIAAPRSRRAAAVVDLLIYERGLDLGAISPDPRQFDSKALYKLIVQAMTGDTGHRGIKPNIPTDLSVAVDGQALAHVLRTAALHFKTEKPLSVRVGLMGNALRIQCKSAASKAIVDDAGLRRTTEKSLAMLGAELDLDPLTPSTLSLIIKLPAPGKSPGKSAPSTNAPSQSAPKPAPGKTTAAKTAPSGRRQMRG